MKILRIRYDNLPLFKDGKLDINFTAMDRVVNKKSVFSVYNNIYSERIIAFVGINATGKTTILKLINLAMQIVVGGKGLDEPGVMESMLIDDGIKMTVDFFKDDQFYQLQSVFGIDRKNNRQKFIFRDEVLLSKSKYCVTSKKKLFDYEDSETVTKQARTDIDSEKLQYLKSTDSMVLGIVKNTSITVENVMQYTDYNFSNAHGAVPHEVLRVFDPSVESLTSQDINNHMVWTVKFIGKEANFSTDIPTLLNVVLSSGTIKGQNIFAPIIDVLKRGGYFIIDELENHLNKELVRVIIDIFNDEKTNPKGSCLIFTTHYPEILDFLDRKDNIYITRKEKYKLVSFNYANKINRNDIKKSEIFLSNYLKGTAPLYENIKELKGAICKIVQS